MRALIQRVSTAQVWIEGRRVGHIGHGLLVLLGVAQDDKEDDAAWLAQKVAGLRIFGDADGKMSRSLRDVGGAVLVVSQFTLYGRVRRGLRPDFAEAAPAAKAQPLYEFFITCLRDQGLRVETGEFGAHMEVHLTNDGPVTLLIESRER
ncbi:MAG: D-aminoacyl-tRNA deacylase [Firmicutes bacterium]|nr:D-aminoacyl-tRNA deacylase [Bacillota bacterium]